MFGLFTANTTLALSIERPHPDPWYKIQVVIDKSSLPSGIKIINQDSILNETSEPLYVFLNGSKYKFVDGKTNLFLEEENRYIEIQGTTPVFYRNEGLQFERPIEDIYADNRPVNVSIPKPNQFTFPAEYKEKTIIISGQAIYSLNLEYNPNAGKPNAGKYEQSKTNNFQKMIAGIFSIGFIVFAFKLMFESKKPLL